MCTDKERKTLNEMKGRTNFGSLPFRSVSLSDLWSKYIKKIKNNFSEDP